MQCTMSMSCTHEAAHDAMCQVGRRGEEMSTLRAQSITWASENKARRAEAGSLRRELDELKREHGAVVSSATMWEERSNKLQDELKLKAGPRVQRVLAHTALAPEAHLLPQGCHWAREGRALAASRQREVAPAL